MELNENIAGNPPFPGIIHETPGGGIVVSTFDSVINLTLDQFNSNLLKKKMSWENSSMKLQTNNKKKLAELGLRIHDI